MMSGWKRKQKINLAKWRSKDVVPEFRAELRTRLALPLSMMYCHSKEVGGWL